MLQCTQFRKQIAELHDLLENKFFSSNKFYVNDINDTWLIINGPDSLMTNRLSYYIYRTDRPSCGGVCLIVFCTILCYRVAIAECFSNADILAVYISFLWKTAHEYWLQSPNSKSDYVNNSYHYLDDLTNVDFTAIVLGNFNFPDISWDINIIRN